VIANISVFQYQYSSVRFPTVFPFLTSGQDEPHFRFLKTRITHQASRLVTHRGPGLGWVLLE